MLNRLVPAALFAAAATTGLADATALTRLLPADADLVLIVDDVPRLKTANAETPAMRAWADPEIQAWLAPLRERFDWAKFNEEARAESGASPDDVIGWIEGGAVLAFRDFSRMASLEGDPAPFVAAVEFGDNADEIAGFLGNLAKRRIDERGFREEVETYAGVEVHSLYPPEHDEPPADGEMAGEETEGDEGGDDPVIWAIDDGVLVISPVKDEVLALLDAREDGGAANPLAGSARLQRLEDATGENDVLISLRIPRLVAMMEAALAAKAAGGEPNPMVPPPRALIEGLGLDAWEDVWLGWRIEGAETLAHYGLSYREPRGLLTLLQHEARSFPQPDWIPADWKNVAVYRFETNQFLPRLQQIVTTISPPLGGMMQGMLAQMAQKTGVDLQRDLLSRFGDELIAVQRFESIEPGENPTAAMNNVPQMIVLSVNDGTGLETALNTLIQSGGPQAAQMLKTRDYLGHRLTSFEPPVPEGAPAQGSFHYAITDRYLFLGMMSAAPVEEALQAVSRGGGEFWQREDVREALRWAPPDATGLQVQDLPSLFAAVVPAIENAMSAGLEQKVQQARQAAEEAGEDPDAAEQAVREETRFTDPSRVPSAEVFAKYFGVNWSYFVQDGTSLRAVVRMLPPNP